MFSLDTPLREFFASFYIPTRLVGRSKSNIAQYEIQFRHFQRFLCHEPLLSDLTDETVSRFMGWFLDQGRAAATVNKARNHLVALWTAAARKRIVHEFPEVAEIPEPERIPEAWSLPQLQKLLQACAETPGMIGKVRACLFWTAIHHVWWDTGERTGATLDLLFDHFDFDGRWLSVPASVRKGRRKPMLYRLRTATCHHVRALQLPGRNVVFEWPATGERFWTAYGKLLKRAGLPNRRKDKPQKMRVSFASHLEANGGNATAALSHTSRRVTQESYLDPRIIKKRAACDRLPPLDQPDKAG